MTVAYDDAVIEFLISQSRARAGKNFADAPLACSEGVEIFEELDSLDVEEFARIYTIYLLGADSTCAPDRAKQLASVAGFTPLEDVARDVDLHSKLAVGKERWRCSTASAERRHLSAEPMHVSTLTAADVLAYRALMLEAYEQAPDAFTTTAAEREAEPESWWVKRIGSADDLATSFGAWKDDGSLIGTVALQYAAKPKTRHSALVLGMYVQPQERGKAVGLALLKAAIAAASARPEILSLNLTLTEGNTPALRLYRSVGFVEWGTQPQAIRTHSGLQGKVHMSLALSRPHAAA